MHIQLNGETKQVNSNTVSAVLEELNLSHKKIAVELNKQIVKKDNYQSTSVKDGDQIEIVQFVGGG